MPFSSRKSFACVQLQTRAAGTCRAPGRWPGLRRRQPWTAARPIQGYV